MKRVRQQSTPKEIRLATLEREYHQAIQNRNNLRNEIEIEAESLRIMRTNLRLENETVREIRQKLSAFKKELRAR